MTPRAAWLPVPAPRAELAALLLLAWAALAAVPVVLGGIGLGWDALNHHVYLGWVADAPRFDRDYLGANYQGYQYPYLYWPLYKLMALGVDGVVAGVVLDSLYLTVVPALWMIGRAVAPGRSWEALALRVLGVALAFLSGAVLSHLDSTSNDMLAAVPLVWAVACALRAFEPDDGGWLRRHAALLSGVFAGMAVAFKLSNGPLVLVLPLLWVAPGPGLGRRLRAAVLGSGATLASFLACYGWWGWQLWLQFGNPLYPFHGPTFTLLRRTLGIGP